MFDRKGCKIVEQAFLPRELRDQHHAGEEQIDVDALAHAVERGAPRQEPEQHQRRSASQCPDRFRHPKWPDDNARRSQEDDARGQQMTPR